MRTIIDTVVWAGIIGVTTLALMAFYRPRPDDPPGYRETVNRLKSHPNIEDVILRMGDTLENSLEEEE